MRSNIFHQFKVLVSVHIVIDRAVKEQWNPNVKRPESWGFPVPGGQNSCLSTDCSLLRNVLVGGAAAAKYSRDEWEGVAIDQMIKNRLILMSRLRYLVWTEQKIHKLFLKQSIFLCVYDVLHKLTYNFLTFGSINCKVA